MLSITSLQADFDVRSVPADSATPERTCATGEYLGYGIGTRFLCHHGTVLREGPRLPKNGKRYRWSMMGRTFAGDCRNIGRVPGQGTRSSRRRFWSWIARRNERQANDARPDGRTSKVLFITGHAKKTPQSLRAISNPDARRASRSRWMAWPAASVTRRQVSAGQRH